ncbi:MAG: Rieske 2Fe-2S domain-containing protein [Candidatus Neomarinimicrobiota bacterium]
MVDTVSRPDGDGHQAYLANETYDEAYGASQIGPFDYCPKLGFREYWYPGVWAKHVGTRRPVHLNMLGEDLVLFRGKDGTVVALTDWCPHRGARLSRGLCEFQGTVTCPYHGYTFDDTGQCVAGLIESPNSTLAPKMRAHRYPTAEWQGIVFVWMGETEPVPLDEDLPHEFFDPQLTGRRYTRVKVWETNWTEPVLQGIDYHELYLHRGLNFWRLVDKRLPFFRPQRVYTGRIRIVEEGENYANFFDPERYAGQAEYPGLGKWPRRVWWRVLPSSKGGRGGKPWVNFNHSVELPSKIRTVIGASIHLRWMVPVTEEDTRVWTFTLVRQPQTWPGALFQAMWYYCWRKPNIIVATNEKEDLVVFKKERLNLERPQKLGPLDVGVIYFRRHLARRARDFQRLGGARGCYKQPPPPRTERTGAMR